MKNKKLYTFVLLLTIGLSIGYAQQDFIYRGKIVDANTNLPLQDVSIYRISASDTLKTQCNSNGEFQLSLKVGSKLLLKKSGYAWQIVRITNNDLQQIKLAPSKPDMEISFSDAGGSVETDVYFGGLLVPKEEWVDAFSGIDNSYTLDIRRSKDRTRILYYWDK